MNTFNKIFNLLMEELNADQKAVTDTYAKQRAVNLSFRSNV